MMEQEYHVSVEDTNEEALASKISAVRKGYIKDSFAEEFAPFKGNRDIIMHRGYWARVYLVRKLVEKMLALGNDCQVIALGAGLETLWFNLQEENQIKNQFTFLELDLPGVVDRKIRKIEKSNKIQNLLSEHNLKQQISVDRRILCCGDSYKLAACDISSEQQFQKVLNHLGLNPKKPTFLYAECVLSYIDADKVDSLLKYISANFSLAFFFDYEMYQPNDRFGQMMVKNFHRMGCDLVGIYKYPQLKDQTVRFENCGFKRVYCQTMARIYYDSIDKDQRQKIEKLQMLDELEEWNLIMGHYFGLLGVAHSQDAKETVPNFENFVQNMKID